MASYLIARIVGNSLPPRHSASSNLRTTEYIIRREPRFQDSERIWIVNKLVSQQEKSALTGLLEQYGEKFIDLPFDEKAHYDEFLDITGIPFTDRCRTGTSRLADLDPIFKEWALRHKSQKLIGINQARNQVLEFGRSRYDWTLVLDGGVMFTPAGWKDFVAAVKAPLEARFAVIAMRRALSWSDDDTMDGAASPEEPQLAFHCQSSEVFDERLRYGNRNKVELLSRLGVAGHWMDWGARAWDRVKPLPAPNAGRYVQAGSVVRLPADGKGVEEGPERFKNRFTGVENRSKEADTVYALRNRRPEAEFQTDVSHLKSVASLRALGRVATGLMSERDRHVVDKKLLAPSGDIHDYFSVAPYWSKSGQYFDGVLQETIPDDDPSSGRYDRTSLQHFVQRVYGLAFAGRLLDRKDMSAKASDLVRAWLIDPATRMTPTARYAQRIPGREKSNDVGIIEFRGFSYLPYAIRILVDDGALRPAELSSLKLWFGDFLRDSERSGILERSVQRNNNIATWASATFCATALFANDFARAFDLARDATVRLGMQLGPFSMQHHEVERSRPLHYSLFNLSGWWSMKRLAGEFAIDLQRYAGVRQESLESAVRFCAGNRHRFPDYGTNSGAYDVWIDILTDVLSASQRNRNVWLVKTFDWGLPPIVHYEF